jgi:serine/threonine protein kinase
MHDAMRWACQIVDAVVYMHSDKHRVVHRDIKLENVLLTSSDVSRASVKLVDFGLAVQLGMRARCDGSTTLKEFQRALRTGAALVVRGRVAVELLGSGCKLAVFTTDSKSQLLRRRL